MRRILIPSAVAMCFLLVAPRLTFAEPPAPDPPAAESEEAPAPEEQPAPEEKPAPEEPAEEAKDEPADEPADEPKEEAPPAAEAPPADGAAPAEAPSADAPPADAPPTDAPADPAAAPPAEGTTPAPAAPERKGLLLDDFEAPPAPPAPAPGEVEIQELPPPAPEPAAEPAPAPPPAKKRASLLGEFTWTLLVGGGVWLGAAAGMQASAQTVKREADEVAVPRPDMTEVERRSRYEDAQARVDTRNNIAYALYGVAGAALVSGTILLIVGATSDDGEDAAFRVGATPTASGGAVWLGGGF